MTDWNSLYLAAHYRIELETGWHALKLNQLDVFLENWMQAHEAQNAAWITPFNPMSEAKPELWNQRQLERMASHIQGFEHYPAESSDPSGAWPNEIGYWIVGIAPRQCAELAQQFQQRAWLQWHHDRLRLQWR